MRASSDHILLTIGGEDEELLRELAALAHDGKSFLVVPHSASERLSLRINSVGPCVLLFVISSVDQIKELANEFRTELLPYIRRNTVTAIAVNRVRHHEIPRILKKIGFSEVISSASITAPSLKVRIEAVFRSMFPVVSQTIVRKSERFDRIGTLVVRECKLEILDPLGVESDCWLLRKPQDIRIVNEQWIIDLIGPGPSVGRWARLPAAILNPSDGHSIWEWKPRKKHAELFVSGEGSWVFEGKKPKFDDFHWTFTSKYPKLTYFEREQAVVDFFRIGEGRILHIAQNSDIAKNKWPAIQASVLNDYHLPMEWIKNARPKAWNLGAAASGPSWHRLMAAPEEQPVPSVSNAEVVKKITQFWAPGKQLFNPIDQPEERANVIREIAESECSALLWTHGQRIRFAARLRGAEDQYHAIILELPKTLSPVELMTALREQEESRLYVNIALRRGSVFFSTVSTAVSIEEDCLRIDIPDEIYQVQRRSHFRRIFLTEDKTLFVRIGSEFNPVSNISGGGMAFSADLSQQAVFEPGTVLKKISFIIYNETISCKAVVRWRTVTEDGEDGKPEDRLSIGIQFEGLRVSDQQLINLYVLEEGFEYFRKYTLYKAENRE